MPHVPTVALMIVEDDPNTRFLLQVAAEQSGLYGPITVAPDGRAALELLESRDVTGLPGLISSDLSMPRMTGLELLRTLKANPVLRSIPVAIVTSSDVPNDREIALLAGACS